MTQSRQPPPVPFHDLARRAHLWADRFTEIARRVIESGWYVLGPETEAFEATFAAFCGTTDAVAVGNGTDALEIALRAVGCAPGDEVIVVANAGGYATTACLAIGATPVFADVHPETLLLDISSAASIAGASTRAVVATHLYGNVADVDALREALPDGVAIVEDAAQAHGAALHDRPVGSLGDAAAFSFYPTKNLGGLGDAGAIVSNHPEVVRRARALRQYGWEQRYRATIPGGRNSRMDEIQAALLCELLGSVHKENHRRAVLRDRYVEALSDRVTFVRSSEGAHPATHLCVARSPRRDELLAHLHDRGIGVQVHYPVPDHRQQALVGPTPTCASLMVTERACDEVLSLPCFPDLRDEEAGRVIDALGSWT